MICEGRKEGRQQRKQWKENTREWTGMEFGKSQKAVEKSESWGKLDAASFAVLQ